MPSRTFPVRGMNIPTHIFSRHNRRHRGPSWYPTQALGHLIERQSLGSVDLLLLVDAELAGAAVDEQQETADDGQDLEKVVLGKVLVGMVLVELSRVSNAIFNITVAFE